MQTPITTMNTSFTLGKTVELKTLPFISAGEVRTDIDIDYEALSSHNHVLPVTLSDGRANLTSYLTIDVIDVNEPITWDSPVYRLSVDENTVS